MWPNKIPKIAYFFWDDSPMSYLRYLTLFTFRQYNPKWEMILYRPLFPIKYNGIIEKNELMPPHSINYNGINYIDRIKELNIKEKLIDFGSLGIIDNIQLVHKVAFLKYYLLSEGGLWSDMDILYIKPIEELIITGNHVINGTPEDIDIGISFYKKDWNKDTKGGYYYTGFLFSSKNNLFFKNLLKKAKDNIDKESYLSLDGNFWKKLYPDINTITKHYPKCTIYNIDEKGVYRYWWGDLNILYQTEPKNNPFVNDKLEHEKGVIGIHWFGGVPMSEIYMNNMNKILKQNTYNFNGIINNLIEKCKSLDNKRSAAPIPIKKISIVMSYYNRKKQLLTTLETIKQTKHTNYEVIIIDDNSDENHKLNDILNKYHFVKLISVNKNNKNWINPCTPYNIGFREATGDIIIIQNPECCHIGDVLVYIENHLREQDYFTFSCFSSKNEEMNNQFENILCGIIDNKNFWTEDKFYKITEIINKSNNKLPYTWYNHQVYNPSRLHFLSAIYKKHIDKIKGFDEKYKNGYCFDDNDFLNKIKYELELEIKIIPYISHDAPFIPVKSNVFCIHLHHEKNYVSDFMDKFNINKNVFEENHKMIVNKTMEKLKYINLFNNEYTLPNNNFVKVKRKINNNNNIMNIINKDSQKDFFLNLILNIPNEIISEADKGVYDIKTNIKGLLKKNLFEITFEAKVIEDNESKIYILASNNNNILISLNKEYKKFHINVEIDIDKFGFKIYPKKIFNLLIKNFSVKLLSYMKTDNIGSTLSTGKNIISQVPTWKYSKIPKKAFTYWAGSMSYLHYLTLKSFKILNPGWELTLYQPLTEYKGENTWRSGEHKIKYTGKNYIKEVKKLGINIKKIDLVKIGFRDDVPEVFKSNYVTYYILSKKGGVWIDMDILFIKPMNHLNLNGKIIRGDFNSIELAICYYGGIDADDKDKYFSTGMLLGTPNSKFYKYLLERLIENFNPKIYMSATNLLYPKAFDDINGISKIFPNLHFANLSMDDVYPYRWNQMDILFQKNDLNYIKENTIGIHWYNGSHITKEFINKADYTCNVSINNIIKKYLPTIIN